MEKDKVMKRFAVADEEKINELKNKTKNSNTTIE